MMSLASLSEERSFPERVISIDTEDPINSPVFQDALRCSLPSSGPRWQ